MDSGHLHGRDAGRDDRVRHVPLNRRLAVVRVQRLAGAPQRARVVDGAVRRSGARLRPVQSAGKPGLATRHLHGDRRHAPHTSQYGPADRRMARTRRSVRRPDGAYAVRHRARRRDAGDSSDRGAPNAQRRPARSGLTRGRRHGPRDRSALQQAVQRAAVPPGLQDHHVRARDPVPGKPRTHRRTALPRERPPGILARPLLRGLHQQRMGDRRGIRVRSVRGRRPFR